MSSKINPTEWKARCSARFIEVAGVKKDFADRMAEACFEDDHCDSPEDPEYYADEEMLNWDDDV